MKIQSNKVKRNEPCPCGSGLKTKHCCLTKILAARSQIDAGKSIEQIIVDQILNPSDEPVCTPVRKETNV
ncbi:MAG: SEC-C metal-binding domain-containing protein [Planctomycetota bacterium]|jgi:hypothetical protein